MMRRLVPVPIAVLVFLFSLQAQSSSPPGPPPVPKAVYTPAPEYRAEWAKQGLTGKGVVLLTVDKATGRVTGAQMLESTGNKLLDGSALQAYSQWRFQPGTVSQIKMPIEFSNRPREPAPNQPTRQPSILTLLVVFVLGAGLMAFFKRRRSN